MDPDANLEELRLLRADFDRHGMSLGAEAIGRIVELSTALDEWMSKGGFPPKDWKGRE